MQKFETIDDFINFFESIPEEQWTKGNEGVYGLSKQRCAIGHLNLAEGNTHIYFGKLADKLAELLIEGGIHNDGAVLQTLIFYINDGICDDFRQKTPKQRILAACRLAKYRLEPVEVSDPPVYVEEIMYTPGDEEGEVTTFARGEYPAN